MLRNLMLDFTIIVNNYILYMLINFRLLLLLFFFLCVKLVNKGFQDRGATGFPLKYPF